MDKIKVKKQVKVSRSKKEKSNFPRPKVTRS